MPSSLNPKNITENMEYHHYPKFENAMRTDLKSLPEGLNAEAYLELSNVDSVLTKFRGNFYRYKQR